MDQDLANTAVKPAVMQPYFLGGLTSYDSSRTKKALEEIQLIHNQRYGNMAFILNGTVIANGYKPMVPITKLKAVDPEFKDEAIRLTNRLKRISLDETRLKNFFSTFAPFCQVIQDYRDVVPDIVSERCFGDQITALPRTRPVGYVFLHDPLKMQIFEENLKLVMKYLVKRLVT